MSLTLPSIKDVTPNHFQSMNEKKKKKPLLSYEQVVDMIEEHIVREENACDERIVRVEKAAEELEANKHKKEWKRRSLLRFLRKLFRTRCRK